MYLITCKSFSSDQKGILNNYVYGVYGEVEIAGLEGIGILGKLITLITSNLEECLPNFLSMGIASGYIRTKVKFSTVESTKGILAMVNVEGSSDNQLYRTYAITRIRQGIFEESIL